MDFKNAAKSLLEKLSRYRLLRVVPLLRLHFHRNESQEAFAKYQQRINELRRSLFFFRFAPAKYRGGLLLNVLGFQFLRYFYFNLRYKLRTHAAVAALPAGYFRDITANGYAIWPSALSAADIAALLLFFDRHAAQRMSHFEDFAELLIADSRGPASQSEDYRDIHEFIRKVTHWDEVGRSLTGRKLLISPYVAILQYRSSANIPLQQDGQDTPHSDVFYPSFKVFFYLNDVDPEGGPLTFYKGSQVFGFRRALQEYVDSIRYFAGAKNEIKPISGLEYAERGGHAKSLLTGPAGTAILFNVQGVHRRGDFLKDRDRERKVLLIDFRQVEVGFQRLAA